MQAVLQFWDKLNEKDTGSCNDKQTVKISFLYSMSKARTYAMESPKSVHFYVVVRSFLCYFVDIESVIE